MAIYYCSWATGGDTTGGGTAVLPWKTITKATTDRLPGDEIRVAKSPNPTALTGTTGFTQNSTAVTGVGTLFTTEPVIGDFIQAPDGHPFYGAEDEPIYEVIIILAACNIYQIEQENRNLLIENENRIFAIDEEQRDYSIPFEDRVYEVTC